MKITDTHTHLYMKQFDKDRDFVIKTAIHNKIHKLYIPSIDCTTIPKILKLEKKYPNICFPMIGLHPSKVTPENLENELNSIKKWLDQHTFISIGEIGIDLHLEKKFLFEQEYAFQTQIQYAKIKKLPIVIHCRKAFDQVFDILKKNYPLKGIFHCFSGNLEQAKKIINFGLKIGIGGMITFKNNNISSFLHKINLKNIVLETDSPFLSPYPLLKGKRNEPIYLKIILKKLSNIYSISEKKIANITEINVNEIFS
ncbi:TatD family hydrolase [Blattabacterium punctulatus]|uniref:TatD family hydrolase n=1 Tax=Blattabacterium punctulatus TaxID=164514 RepID=UPI000D7CC1E3|nr:TatD family hydrolase [Blattabacterium punctulatus]AWU45135.1 hydrolase TatD [Blattabacterium punctulatus]